jgi:hypothetical protein
LAAGHRLANTDILVLRIAAISAIAAHADSASWGKVSHAILVRQSARVQA